jgi:ABC-type uncharacterized transport system ATPase subunit
MCAATNALELSGITKRFGSLLANDEVDLALRQGEVHALLGENGAGKSTLMNIASGLIRPDAGEMRVGGRQVQPRSPAEAIATGVGMVHQHFMLVPVFTVAENVILGAEPGSAGKLDRRAARDEVARLSADHGLEVDPDALVGDLGVGLQQRVEILRALYRRASVLILDEPTAVLAGDEVVRLLDAIRALRAAGTSIILISHKLEEVLAVADRISVLRAGRLVATLESDGASQSELAALMVGRPLQPVVRAPSTPGDRVLAVDDLWIHDARGLPVVRGTTLTVREGEIVGIAAIEGNGQSELVEAVAGMRPVTRGSIEVDGVELTGASSAAVRRHSVGHVPSDRLRDGLVTTFSLVDNVFLTSHDRPPLCRHGWLRPRVAEAHAQGLIDRYDVRGATPSSLAGSLSGGNQQKFVLAREQSGDPRLLLAANPTRGLDVGAIEFVHGQLLAGRDAGRAVLLVSSELEEVLALADRILVLYEGHVVLERAGDSADAHELGLAMSGALREAA